MSNQPPPPPGFGAPPPPGGAMPAQAGAGVGQRIGARIIDFIILFIVYVIIAFFAVLALFAADTTDPGFMSAFGGGGVSAASIVLGLISLAIFFGYFVGMETSMGGTVGKKLLGLKVIGASGGDPTVEESFKRNSWMVLSIVPVIGWLLELAAAIYIIVTISQSATNTGWNDEFANSRVVATK